MKKKAEAKNGKGKILSNSKLKSTIWKPINEIKKKTK